MTTTNPPRHPFLDDLADDVVLVSSVLRQPVRGRATVLKVVKAGAAQYARQSAKFLDTVDHRSYFDYDITLHDGQQGSGLVAIHRDPAGKVVTLHIAFSPLPAVWSIAAGVRDALAGELDAALFLMGEQA